MAGKKSEKKIRENDSEMEEVSYRDAVAAFVKDLNRPRFLGKDLS